MSVELFRRELQTWLRSRDYKSVVIDERTEFPADPRSDYTVVFEIEFKPTSRTQGNLEFWLTDNGEIGIGFERRKRIAERLNVKHRNCLWGSADAFVAGFEPMTLTVQEALLMLDLVSKGQLIVKVGLLPWCGLGPTSVVINSPDVAAANLCNNFNSLGRVLYGTRVQTVPFDPWT